MELNYLKEFIVLAEVGNYLEAADQLYISQSSLSRHIKSMEDELGTPLFHRARKISLSEFGKIFLPYAHQMVNLQQSYQQELFDYKRSVHGTLSVGSIPAIKPYHILDALSGFRKENPDYTVNFLEGDTLQLAEMILDERLELAFVRDDSSISDQFCEIPFATDHLAAVIPADHPLAEKSSIHLQELQNETLLMLASDTFMHKFCVRACLAAGFQPIIGYTGRRGDNLIAMAEQGTGVALLTKKPIESQQSSLVKVVDIIPELTTSISLIYKKDKKLSTGARRFISFLNDFPAD